jgi:hypothetical protein
MAQSITVVPQQVPSRAHTPRSGKKNISHSQNADRSCSCTACSACPAWPGCGAGSPA